jgi:hypothetical protein
LGGSTAALCLCLYRERRVQAAAPIEASFSQLKEYMLLYEGAVEMAREMTNFRTLAARVAVPGTAESRCAHSDRFGFGS